MDSDAYSADAPGSIPTLLTISVLVLQNCSIKQPRNPLYGDASPTFLTHSQSLYREYIIPLIIA